MQQPAVCGPAVQCLWEEGEMNLRDAAQQALEAMDKATRFMSDSDYVKLNQAIYTLKAALAESANSTNPVVESEPVAWLESPHGQIRANPLHHQIRSPQSPTWSIPLYTNPPRREWQGLTDEEIGSVYVKWDETPGASMADFARVIEAALKEKNK
jgi:hypothetical protein